ncbi:MAG: HAD family phosphatase [Chitinophagales bacterium]|nr:HAD family phosphatase [Chitinophagales bacterium]
MAHSNHIKSIIFDYGGVIIDVDYSRTHTAFERLGVSHFKEQYSQLRQQPLFDDFETGKTSEKTFRSELNKLFGTSFSDAQIDDAWNAMLLGIREDRITLLKDLYPQYDLFLLSNTNFIHLKFITKYLIRTYQRADLESYFKKVYYSFVIGVRKPHPDIFKRVINENNLSPSETLFIDDSLPNVEAAKALGFNAVLYKPADDLRSVVESELSREKKVQQY